MDNFREEVAVRRNPGLYSFLYVVCYALLILAAFIGLSMLMGALSSIMEGQFDLVGLLFGLVSGGAAFLLWRNKDELKTEYEYAFTNGELDVAKVLNNSRRKYLTALPLKNVEAVGAVSSPSFQRYVTMPNIKKHNWFLNRDANLYYFYFTKTSVKHLMVVELSDEMMKLVKSQNYLGFGVWQG